MVQLHTTGDDGTLTRIPPEKNSLATVWNNGPAQNGDLLLQTLVKTWKGSCGLEVRDGKKCN